MPDALTPTRRVHRSRAVRVQYIRCGERQVHDRRAAASVDGLGLLWVQLLALQPFTQVRQGALARIHRIHVVEVRRDHLPGPSTQG